jgi:hypothetical protein
MQISSPNERTLQGETPVHAECCRIDRLAHPPFSDRCPDRAFRPSAATFGAEQNLYVKRSAPIDILAEMPAQRPGAHEHLP